MPPNSGYNYLVVDTNKELLLARPLKEVKKLSSSVTLESYYKHIKPFLFGTNSTDLVNLESVTSGVYALASDGKLTPGKDIFIEIAGAGNKFKTIDIKKNKTVLDFQSKKERTSEYFLPSDFVSILTALARIFYSGSTVGTAAYRYNEDGLSDYAATATSQGDISFVKKWGEAGVEQIIPPAKPGETPAISPEENINWFYEYKLVDKNVSKVEKLLQEVAKAALEFEKLKQPLNTNDFKAKSEIEKLLLVDIQQKIIDDFEAYNSKVKPKISTEPKFAEASKKILGKIEELIKSKSADLVYSLFSLENTKIFTDKKIFSPERQTALWEARDEDALLGISLSDEYSTFLETETKNFLDRYKTDLEKDYIDPLFVESEEETAEAGEKSEDDTESGDAASSQEEITEILSEDKLKEKIEENLSESIYKLFVEKYIYEDSGRKQLFEPQKDNFENQYLEPLTEQLEKTIYEKVTNNFKFEANILEELEKENLYKEEVFSEKLLESEIYKDFIKNRTQFISEISSPDSNYGSYFEFLYNQFVVPALDLLYDSPTPPDSDESAADTDTADSDESERISSASVPTDISTPIPVPQVGETTFVSGDISTLSPEQLRSLQYESAWMYNRAIYELFTVHGLSESDLDPVLLAKMNAEIFDFIAGMDEKSLNLMFGSASQRQKALLQFYQKFNQTNNLNEYYDKLKETDAWQKLTSKQQEGLAATTNRLLVNKTIFTTEDLLQISLREALEIDSPVLNQNIKNSIDALIIKHGINQTFYAYNQDTKEVISYKAGSDKDALWEIENMPDGRLALIFNLPSDTRFTDKKVLKLLKDALKKYAKHRASDLALHIKATSLAEGFVHIGADLETVRSTIKKFGAKTVAGGFDEKSAVLDEDGNKIKDGSNRKELIKKQFASFIPLWNHLTPQEQALIYYETLGYIPKGNPNAEVDGYDFIPEFIFFDLSKLDSIKRMAQQQHLSEKKKQELYELLAINEQLAKEEAFANY